MTIPTTPSHSWTPAKFFISVEVQTGINFTVLIISCSGHTSLFLFGFSIVIIMASVSQDPQYQVMFLLNKAVQVDGAVGKWTKDEVDGCLENLAASVVLLNTKKVGRKKTNREKTTFHDGLPATVVVTGSDTPCSLVLKRSMVAEIERYTSFLHRNWPTNAPVSPSKLAKAGFFYAGDNDTVICFSCHGRINNWDHGDTAMGEHKRLYPKCKFVRGVDNRNVPYRGLVDETPGTTESKSSSKSEAPSASQNAATGSEDDLVRILKPLSLQESKPTTETLACFKREINRLLSFRTWPITSPVDRYDLASAGFYCVNDTTVQCFACFGRISEWRLGDRPRDEHRRLFPACPFISGHRTENVPLSASEKEQAIKHFAQSTARESQPHQISSFASDFQRIGGGSSVHGRTTHPLQLVTNQEPTDLTVRYAKYPDKAYEQARLETFYQWPITHNQIPANLARAGFFATGNDDEVKCFYCGGGLKDWDEGDDPWEEHARWFTRCEWLLQQRGPGFVDIVRRKFNQPNQSYFGPNMGIPADQSTTQQPSPPPEDPPSSKGTAQSASSAAAAEPAARPREEGRKKKGETKRQQPKKQGEKRRQTKKTKSLEERIEEAFQSDVAQFMIDMGQDERIVRTVIRKRIQSGQRPYESSEDLLTAIFEEEASPQSGSGESAQPVNLEGAAGPRENGACAELSSGGEDSNEAISEESRENEPQLYPDFDEFLTTLAEELNRDNTMKLCTFFDFPPPERERIVENSKPAKTFLLHLWKKGIIQPDDTIFLHEALTHLNLSKAATKLKTWPLEMTSSVSVEQLAHGDMQSEELEKLREKNLCKICLDNDVEILFLPCKHLVTCSECAYRIDTCPICRELIDNRLYVYMP